MTVLELSGKRHALDGSPLALPLRLLHESVHEQVPWGLAHIESRRIAFGTDAIPWPRRRDKERSARRGCREAGRNIPGDIMARGYRYGFCRCWLIPATHSRLVAHHMYRNAAGSSNRTRRCWAGLQRCLWYINKGSRQHSKLQDRHDDTSNGKIYDTLCPLYV